MRGLLVGGCVGLLGVFGEWRSGEEVFKVLKVVWFVFLGRE